MTRSSGNVLNPKTTKDLTGQKFGKLTVIGFDGYHRKNGKKTSSYFFCQCDCGNITSVKGHSLVISHTVSCGKCTTHKGLTAEYPNEYLTYAKLNDRCSNPNDPKYHNYGAIGIKVCDVWLNGEDGLSGFECFIRDVGPRPFDDATLDRIDGNLGYFKENVRWVSYQDQERNKKDREYIIYEGKKLFTYEAAAMLRLSVHSFKKYMSKWGTNRQDTFDRIRREMEDGTLELLRKPTRRVEYLFEGQKLTITEICEILGFNPSYFYTHARDNNLSFQELIDKLIQNKNNGDPLNTGLSKKDKILHDGKLLSLKSAIKLLPCSGEVFYRLSKKYGFQTRQEAFEWFIDNYIPSDRSSPFTPDEMANLQ